MDLSFDGFLTELGMRIGAAAVVLGIFFGLGYLNRTESLGGLLGNQFAFFTVAFLLVGGASVGWILFQRARH